MSQCQQVRMSSDKNLVMETIEALETFGHSEKEVLWVINTCSDKKCSWEKFKQLGDFWYDSGFGTDIIDPSLEILGNGWWLERHEYDGSEWWEYKKYPIIPDNDGLSIDDILKVKTAQTKHSNRENIRCDNNCNGIPIIFNCCWGHPRHLKNDECEDYKFRMRCSEYCINALKKK